MNLNNLLCDTTNLIEIYLVKKLTDKNAIDLRIGENVVKQIRNQYKNWKTTTYTSYHMNNMIYMYDMTNDNQIVYSKHRNHDFTHKNTYGITYHYSKMPTHLFGCSDQIDDKESFTISETKITNRLSVIIKTDAYGSYIYIEYRHSPNVEIDKIESYINNIITKMDIRV